MISNSRMQITLLSFLFKKFNIIKKGINIKDTLKLYAVLSVLIVLIVFHILFHIRKGRRIVSSAFREFPNIFSYAQKRCARGDTASIIKVCFLLSKYSSRIFALNRSMLHILHGQCSFVHVNQQFFFVSSLLSI